jgi:hypothetical protein
MEYGTVILTDQAYLPRNKYRLLAAVFNFLSYNLFINLAIHSVTKTSRKGDPDSV